jgi:hypothetical protein
MVAVRHGSVADVAGRRFVAVVCMKVFEMEWLAQLEGYTTLFVFFAEDISGRPRDGGGGVKSGWRQAWVLSF